MGLLIKRGFRSAQELSNTGGRSVSEHRLSVVRPLHKKPIEVDKDEGAKRVKTVAMARGIREGTGEST